MTHPGGHPEPEPIPIPEPGPPQPIPPPDPAPTPEPPHAWPPHPAAAAELPAPAPDSTAPAASAGPTDSTAPAAATPAPAVTSVAPAVTSVAPAAATAPATAAAGDVTVPAAPMAADGDTRPTVEVAGGLRPVAGDLFDDELPTAPVEFPPVGAYPGEPGHPEPGHPEPGHPEPGHPEPGHPEPRTQLIAPEPITQLIAAADRPPEPDTQLIAPVHDPTASQPAHWQEPWHAQHERTGEWQTHPPEHLAWEHSPPPIFEEPPSAVGPPAPPWQIPLQTPAEPVRRGRSGLWLSLGLTVVLLLCGGGAISAYFLISNADTGKGAPDPASAVNQFMTAVYAQQNATDAETLVCRAARDPAILAARVAQIKDMTSQYDNPTFRWDDPAVSGRTDDHATVTVGLTLLTDDEKSSSQTLTFTTVHKTGWLVCDISG